MKNKKVRLVYIEGGGAAYESMFKEINFYSTQDISQADLICFTGGSDVDPSLYGEDIHPCTGVSAQRDISCMGIYGYAIIHEIPMVGICRGSQFLCVANGGKLWQHVDNHAVFSGHKAESYCGEVFEVTSTHHQMMRPLGDGFEVLLSASESSFKQSYTQKGGVVSEEQQTLDVEAVVWPDTKCFGFQPHPEFPSASKECRRWFFDTLLERLFGE